MDFKNTENCTIALENISNIAKTYVRISSLKTALTVFLVGYTVMKAIKIFKPNRQI